MSNDYNNQEELILEDKVKTKTPKKYKVIILNDDYTPMDFVVAVLEQIFKLSPAESVKIMLEVHKKGSGLCGIFTKQIAETKISQVHTRAASMGYPLKCTMEEA
jgi:ATP-dependent Clp protease adaptor protein ClpS